MNVLHAACAALVAVLSFWALHKFLGEAAPSDRALTVYGAVCFGINMGILDFLDKIRRPGSRG